MGCDWSKHQDVFKDRQRLVNSDWNPSSSGNSRNSLSKISEDVAVNSRVYGSLTTDCYFKHRDDFEMLLEKSQHAFVDISQEPVLMDEAEAEARRKQYVKEIGGHNSSFGRLGSCPAFLDRSASSLLDILSEISTSYDKHRKDILIHHDSIRSQAMKSSAVIASERSLIVTLESV